MKYFKITMLSLVLTSSLVSCSQSHNSCRSLPKPEGNLQIGLSKLPAENVNKTNYDLINIIEECYKEHPLLEDSNSLSFDGIRRSGKTIYLLFDVNGRSDSMIIYTSEKDGYPKRSFFFIP
jgi:hypothetical protein